MARSKDAGDRRAVLKVLGAIRESTRFLKMRWTVETKLWDLDAPRDANGNVLVRERREDEYPENSQQEWNTLARQCQDQIDALTILKRFAQEQASRPKFTDPASPFYKD